MYEVEDILDCVGQVGWVAATSRTPAEKSANLPGEQDAVFLCRNMIGATSTDARHAGGPTNAGNNFAAVGTADRPADPALMEEPDSEAPGTDAMSVEKHPTPSRIADGRTVTAREMTAATLPGIARCRLAAPAAGSSSRLTSPAAAGEVGHAALLTAGSANLADAARGPVGAEGKAEASVDVTATGAPLAPAATSAPVAHLLEEEDLAAGDEPAHSVHPPSSCPLSSHPRSPLRLGPAPRRRAVRPPSSRALGLSPGHVRPASRLARPAHVRR